MFSHQITAAVCLMFFFALFQSVANSADFSAPLIVLPVSEPLESSGSYRISAKITDDNGIESVLLYYRVIGTENEFKSIPLTPERGSGFYSAVVSVDQQPHQGIEYYVEAKDRASNISQEPFPTHPRQLFYAGAQSVTGSGDIDSSTKKWWWIGLGVLVAGVLVSASSDDNDDDSGTTLVIEAPVP